jgi:hypothetical protein
MGCKALGHDFTVPVWHWHVFRTFGDSLPERLNVLELLVGREFFESRWRKGRLRHASVYDCASDRHGRTPRGASDVAKRRCLDDLRSLHSDVHSEIASIHACSSASNQFAATSRD